MSWIPSAVAVVAVPLALSLIRWRVEVVIQRESLRVPTTQTVFGVSPVMYGICTVSAILGVGLALSFILGSGPENAKFMGTGLGVFWAAFSIAAGLWYTKCEVQLTDEEVILQSPFSRRATRFDHIEQVGFSNAMIVLDEGKFPRFVIPALYRSSGQLLANIHARVKQAHQS